MASWCCATWQDLGVELAEQKDAALDKFIKKGIPRSTFSPIFRILNGITNFCPLCGSKISASLPIPEASKPEKVRTPEPPKSTVPSTIPCPPCRGRGEISGAICLTCLGSKVLDKSNPMRAHFDSNFAKEQADKMERITEKIISKGAEIEKNPQPLREDAKPENWKNI